MVRLQHYDQIRLLFLQTLLLLWSGRVPVRYGNPVVQMPLPKLATPSGLNDDNLRILEEILMIL